MTTKFQQRHYEAIAELVSELPLQVERDQLIERLCALFRNDSARFDAERFRRAAESTLVGRRIA